MKMKIIKKIWDYRNFILAILAILIVIFYINRLQTEIKILRANLPHKLIGEKIDYFDLLSTDAEEVTAAVLNTSRSGISALFIFDRPCSKCSDMITIWNKINKFSKLGNFKAFGIVPDKIEKVVEFSEEGLAKFKLYAPRDLKKFLWMFSIRINLPQTILYKNGEIIYLKLGHLDGSDYLSISKLIKEKIK